MMALPKRKLFVILSCPLPLIIYLLCLYIAYSFVGNHGNNQTHVKDNERIIQANRPEKIENTSTTNLFDDEYQEQKFETKSVNILNGSSVSTLNVFDNHQYEDEQGNHVPAPNTTDTSH